MNFNVCMKITSKIEMNSSELVVRFDFKATAISNDEEVKRQFQPVSGWNSDLSKSSMRAGEGLRSTKLNFQMNQITFTISCRKRTITRNRVGLLNLFARSRLALASWWCRVWIQILMSLMMLQSLVFDSSYLLICTGSQHRDFHLHFS